MSRVFESCLKSLEKKCVDCIFIEEECPEKQLYDKGRADAIKNIQKYVRLHTKYADKLKDDYLLAHDFYKWLDELKEK